MSRRRQLLRRQFLDLIFGTFSDRAVDHTCLAKPAASGATTEEFHDTAVMHDVDERYDTVNRKIDLFQILHNPFFDGIRRFIVILDDFF